MADTYGRSTNGVPARCEFDFDNAKGNVIAYFTLHYGDFAIKGFKIMDGNDAPWVAFPSKKVGRSSDGRWLTTVWIENEKRFDEFRRWALKCYEAARNERQAAHAAGDRE